MQDCIKELPPDKKSIGKVRKFEIRCPNYNVRKRLPEDDDCRYCRKEKEPKIIFIFAGNPPFNPIESDNTFRCGKTFTFGFDAGGKGNPYFTETSASSRTSSRIDYGFHNTWKGFKGSIYGGS